MKGVFFVNGKLRRWVEVVVAKVMVSVAFSLCFFVFSLCLFCSAGCGDSGGDVTGDASTNDLEDGVAWNDSSLFPDSRIDTGSEIICEDDLCVDPENGDDEAGDGSGANPFRTITKALEGASSGMSIGVWPGTLDLQNGEVFPLHLPESTTLRAVMPSEDTIISGGAPTLDVGAGVTVRGFIILPAGSAIEVSRPGDVLIERNTIHSDALPGVKVIGENVQLTLDSNWFAGSLITSTAIDSRDVPSAIVFTGNVYSGALAYGVRLSDGCEADFLNEYFSGVDIAVEITGEADVFVRDTQAFSGSIGFLVGESTENASVDLGTEDDPGGNALTGNDQADLCVSSGAVVYAIGNTWDNDPPEQSSECSEGVDIGVAQGGQVIIE